MVDIWLNHCLMVLLIAKEQPFLQFLLSSLPALEFWIPTVVIRGLTYRVEPHLWLDVWRSSQFTCRDRRTIASSPRWHRPHHVPRCLASALWNSPQACEAPRKTRASCKLVPANWPEMILLSHYILIFLDITSFFIVFWLEQGEKCNCPLFQHQVNFNFKFHRLSPLGKLFQARTDSVWCHYETAEQHAERQQVDNQLAYSRHKAYPQGILKLDQKWERNHDIAPFNDGHKHLMRIMPSDEGPPFSNVALKTTLKTRSFNQGSFHKTPCDP